MILLEIFFYLWSGFLLLFLFLFFINFCLSIVFQMSWVICTWSFRCNIFYDWALLLPVHLFLHVWDSPFVTSTSVGLAHRWDVSLTSWSFHSQFYFILGFLLGFHFHFYVLNCSLPFISLCFIDFINRWFKSSLRPLNPYIKGILKFLSSASAIFPFS